MNIPDLISMFNALGQAFPSAMGFVLALMGAGGLVLGMHSTYEVWQHLTGQGGYGRSLGAGIIFRFGLAGALAVVPVLLWRAANTFVLGGAETQTTFAYLQDTSGGYCLTFSNTLTMFFMLIGLVSWGYAASAAYSISTGTNNASWSRPVWYCVGGVLVFFVNDVAAIVGNTTGMKVGLENICAALGG